MSLICTDKSSKPHMLLIKSMVYIRNDKIVNKKPHWLVSTRWPDKLILRAKWEQKIKFCNRFQRWAGYYERFLNEFSQIVCDY